MRLKIYQTAKIYRKNLNQLLVIIEAPRKPLERIHLDILRIPLGNCIFTYNDESTKFFRAYPMMDNRSFLISNITKPL